MFGHCTKRTGVRSVAVPRPRPAAVRTSASPVASDRSSPVKRPDPADAGEEVPAPATLDGCETVSQKRAFIKRMMKTAWDGYHEHAWVWHLLIFSLSRLISQGNQLGVVVQQISNTEYTRGYGIS